MTRRDAAWAIARAAAVAGAPEFLNAWLRHDEMSAAPPEPDRWTHYEPKFFSLEEMKALDAFTAILIPTDETPGAREARVVPFIDFVLFSAAEYADDMQHAWREAMHRLNPAHFNLLSPAGQLSVVERMSHDEGLPHADFQLIKEMAVHAFYTSRIGLIDVLEYKGNAYLTEFPGCNHSEHHQI